MHGALLDTGRLDNDLGNTQPDTQEEDTIHLEDSNTVENEAITNVSVTSTVL